MKKPKLTDQQKADLQLLRDEIERYQNILQWQRIREAEKKMLRNRNKTETHTQSAPPFEAPAVRSLASSALA